MATLQTRIDRARSLNWVDKLQYDDVLWLQDANIIIHQIEDYITSAIWEWYFWDILKIDTTVIWQTEYSIPILETWAFNWAPKIESISIKYWNEYIKARPINRQTLDYDLTWYEVNQSEADPIYFIADNSVFIYPAPKTAVTNWLKIYWIKSLADAELTTTDEELFWWKIPTKYYYYISDWMEYYIKKFQRQDNEAINAKRLFDNEKLPELVEKLGNRKIWISERWTPNLSKYK